MPAMHLVHVRWVQQRVDERRLDQHETRHQVGSIERQLQRDRRP
jgi:hypothetical protein